MQVGLAQIGDGMFDRRSYMREYMRRRRRLLPSRTSPYRPGQNPASVAARFKPGHPYVGPELTAEHRREMADRVLRWATPERRGHLRELALAWWTPERRAAQAAKVRDRAARRRAAASSDIATRGSDAPDPVGTASVAAAAGGPGAEG